MLKNIARLLKKTLVFASTSPNLYTLALLSERRQRRQSSRNPFFNNCPHYSIYSQSDEDSIIDHIFSILEITNGTFVEMGVGDGTQNNTLNLAAQGWSGAWFGAEAIKASLPSAVKFSKSWITIDNCVDLVFDYLQKSNKSSTSLFDCDLLSIDIDGNDFYIWRQLLDNQLTPRVLIAEFNGTFGPMTKWVMPYNKNNNWKLRKDNYFGASFASLCDLFIENNYVPVCCNTDTAVNLFAVHRTLIDRFDISNTPDLKYIYEPPLYLLHSSSLTHSKSVKYFSSL